MYVRKRHSTCNSELKLILSKSKLTNKRKLYNGYIFKSGGCSFIKDISNELQMLNMETGKILNTGVYNNLKWNKETLMSVAAELSNGVYNSSFAFFIYDNFIYK